MPGPPPHTRSKRSHWWVVFVTGVATIVSGTIGYYAVLRSGPDPRPAGFWTAVDAIYKAIELIAVHAAEFNNYRNPWVEAARWLGVFTFLTTAWFLIVNRLRQEVLLLRLRMWEGHYVICGLSPKAMALIESIKGKGGEARIVVIDPDPDAEMTLRCEGMNVCVIHGDLTRPRQLRWARVAQAREIVAVAVEDEVNIRVAAEVRALRQGAWLKRPDGTTERVTRGFCRAHIANSHLPEALQKWTDAQAAGGGKEPGEGSLTTLRFFDVFDTEARRVLMGITFGEREDAGTGGPIDGPGVRAGEKRRVHVVVLGMGRMGSALVVRAAKMGQFANGLPLRITVIDREAGRQKDELLFRYPVLAGPNQVCDLEFKGMYADSLEARELIERCATEKETVLHVFVCLDSNARAVEIALRLWEIMAEHPQSYVHVRITSRGSVGPILKRAGARIEVFGMLEDTCTVETVLTEQIEVVARAIHREFVAARQADGSAAARAGDPALAAWDHLREDFRESNRQQGDHMGIKMRAIGCRIVKKGEAGGAGEAGEAVTGFAAEEVEMLAELEHRRWNAERTLSGWRYGPQEDKGRRISCYMVAWGDLPEGIKEYDRETVRKLPARLEEAGMKVVRGGR